MIRRAAIGSAVVLALVAGVAAGRLSRPDPAQAHRTRLLQMITAQHAQIGDGGVLVIGDSIVELQRLTRLCGTTTINAGISGARAADLVDFARSAIAAARPSRVVFAVGTNDAWATEANFDAWRATTARLVATWPGRPVIVGINRAGSPAPALVDRMNAALRRIATERGGRYADGLAAHETYDGVHPSLSGSLAWQARVDAACRPPGQAARKAAPNSSTGSSGADT